MTTQKNILFSISSDVQKHGQLRKALQAFPIQLALWNATEANTVVLNRPTEPTSGPLAALIRAIASQQPLAILIDDASVSETIKGTLVSSPATRRLPQLIWSSDTMALDPLLVQIQRVISETEAEKKIDCQRPLRPEAEDGIVLFNAGQYYKAHDPLEEAWNQEEAPDRDLYRALLQVSVAYHHCEKGNYRGGVKLLLRAKQWLAKLPDQCRGVDIGKFRQNALDVEAHLLSLGSEGIAKFDTSRIRPIAYQPID